MMKATNKGDSIMAFKVPEIGEWYMGRQLGQQFKVVAFDDHERTIEIQYVDGELSEVDIQGWRQISVQAATAPEDWSASCEVSREDNSIDEFSGDNRNNPLTTIEPELFEGSDP
tara:strand:- start:29266 stop:29607 length:342 start_codon:yes stop_codon:yes gene_type:complete